MAIIRSTFLICCLSFGFQFKGQETFALAWGNEPKEIVIENGELGAYPVQEKMKKNWAQSTKLFTRWHPMTNTVL